LVNWLQDDTAVDTIVEVFAQGVDLNVGTPIEYTAKFDGPKKHIIKASFKQLLDRSNT
jgi:hypothetical protein